MYSDAYLDVEDEGPFPGRVDPWSEDDHFFNQIHSGMINDLVNQLHRPIRQLGYYVGTETSLQIMRGGKPDIFVFSPPQPEPPHQWDYVTAAAAIAAEPGIETDVDAPDLEGITIFNNETGELVTIIEIISPGNKIKQDELNFYRAKRKELWERGINIVEIDVTRSYTHMISRQLLKHIAYHYAVYLPGAAARIIPMLFHEPLKRLAVPLREQVLPVEPQAAYESAYRSKTIGRQIFEKNAYRVDALSFPSLIPSDQVAALLDSVTTWRARLESLRQV